MSKELLAFKASWCGPCKGMEPVLNSLIEDGAAIKKLDVEAEIELATQYQVKAVPTYVVVEDGKEVDRFIGAQSKDVLESALKT